VLFDKVVNTTVVCEEVFTEDTWGKLGDFPSCIWENEQTLQIKLSTNHTLNVENETITLIGNKILAVHPYPEKSNKEYRIEIEWPEIFPVDMEYTGENEASPCEDYLVSVTILGGQFLRDVYLTWDL